MTKQTYTIQDFIEYREMMRKSIQTHSEEFFFNDTMVHTIMVQENIIKNATENPVLMYCGKFTAFRSKAKDFVDEIKNKVKPSDCNSIEMKKWEDFHPYEDLLGTMTEFFNRGGKMTVLLDDSLTNLSQDEQIWNTVKDAIKMEQLQFLQLQSPVRLDHFTVSGKAFRRENSADERTAICCFNNESTASILTNTFELLKLQSKPISVA